MQVAPILKKSPVEKEKGIIVLLCVCCNCNYIVVIPLWSVDSTIAELALSRKGLTEENSVEMLPERVTASCFDENVDIQSCQKYFTTDGWLAIKNVVVAMNRILFGIVADALKQ